MAVRETTIKRAFAIADLLGYDGELLDEVEGHLLVTAGKSGRISPATISRETALTREAASDLFRQLHSAGALARDSYDEPVVESRYGAKSDKVRSILVDAREAMQFRSVYRERVPQTEVTPLVTFPEDPSFAETSPAAFGMESLMSTLASEVKECEDEIILISPFFEGDGLERLEDVLLDALERGVEVTIVTRYLRDSGSHNYSVVREFVREARDQGADDQLSTVDYTVWGEGVPAEKRRQDGENPQFTLHAKVMTFDSHSVYVGSANVTDYGFGRYLELGVLLSGARAPDFVGLCEFLLTSAAATPVSL